MVCCAFVMITLGRRERQNGNDAWRLWLAAGGLRGSCELIAFVGVVAFFAWEGCLEGRSKGESCPWELPDWGLGTLGARVFDWARDCLAHKLAYLNTAYE